MTHGYHNAGEVRRVAVFEGSVSSRSASLWAVPFVIVGLLACKPEAGSSAAADDAGSTQPAAHAQEAGALDPANGKQATGAPKPTTERVAVTAPPPPPPPSPAKAGACEADQADDVGLMLNPRGGVVGSLNTLVAATFDGEEALAVRLERDGTELDAEFEYRPGIPAATIVRFKTDEPGPVSIVVGREGTSIRCETVKVRSAGRHRPRAASSRATWPVTKKWTAAEEALFSAWVREMFTAPRGEDLAWKALHEVTSDPERNLLHDAYGWSEDSEDTHEGLYLKPDCADAPYFLRAYFAWKRGLPFAFRQCSRGRGKAPRCGKLHPVVGAPEHEPDRSKPAELGVVQRYFRRTLAWGVHSGNGRTAFADDDTDFYPVALQRRALRPGAIYADPYGHIFVLVEMMSPNGTQPGVLYAIDGQPDGSITRKRFWEGNFLWNPDPTLGGSGFKAFRPLDVVGKGENATLVAATDAAIAKRPGYGDVSDEQAKLDAHGFYDKMDALVTPGARDALAAQKEAVQALFEAAKVRVTSVNNGTAFVGKASKTVAMPDGHSIFETTGPWENYSTPARDLRLLIAIDLVRGFDDKVARNADVFARDGESMDDVRKALSSQRDALLADPALSFEYTRSDGSAWKLSVADVIARAEALELGYNPNDCPEIRWGAPSDSDELKTCKRHAPAQQRRKMAAYRTWFAKRQRPARGDPGPRVE